MDEPKHKCVECGFNEVKHEDDLCEICYDEAFDEDGHDEEDDE